MGSIFERFELASIRRMLNNARAVHDYSGKAELLILLDMAKCVLKDHVGYMEYNLFHFVNKPQALRDTYLTFDYSQELFKTLNDPEYIAVFNDKLSFNKLFRDYLKRDFLDLNEASFEEFRCFVEGKEKVFGKPADSYSGKGIYRNFEIAGYSDLRDLYDYLRENHLFIEDSIIQDPDMASLHPSSINTVRVTTLLDDEKEAHVMYTILRIGTGNKSVDNVGSGGIYTVLSPEGELINPCWSDKTISTYTVHPTNNRELIGFKVPYFQEALQLCKQAAEFEPHVRYVGWDVAISDHGPLIVEGNPLPGYDMPQNYFVTGKDSGIKPDFEAVLKI